MCCYIGIVLPDPRYCSSIEPLFMERERRLILRENAFLRKWLSGTESFYITTWAECDCNTALGYRTAIEAVDPQDLQKEEILKLRRKGWSETKIKRSLEASSKKRIHDENNDIESKTRDLNRWKGLLSDCLLTVHMPYIGLLMRQYSGDIEHEEITVLERKRIKLFSLTLDTLSELKDDVIYEFYNK